MSASRALLSACVIARDEEDRIGDCLRSLAFCDDVLVVDSHSTDRTRGIAAELGARVIERDWPGHVAQKEFAIRQAQHDWVLCVDADERVSDGLRAEIEALRTAGFPDRPGWRMPRRSAYLGRWIRHGSWHPDYQLRLFDRRRGRWAGRDPHDRVWLDGAAGTLREPILHHPYRDFAEHLRTIDRYASIQAERLHDDGRRGSLLDVLLRPPWRFFRFYVLERGFLDGWRGLVLALLAAHYVRLRYLKLWLMDRRTEIDSPPS